MITINNIQVLEHFEYNNHIYGKYWVTVNGTNKLIIRKNDEWCSVENYVCSSIKDSVMPITDDFKNKILIALEDKRSEEGEFNQIQIMKVGKR